MLVCLLSFDGFHEGIGDRKFVFFSNGVLVVGGVRGGGKVIEGEGKAEIKCQEQEALRIGGVADPRAGIVKEIGGGGEESHDDVQGRRRERGTRLEKILCSGI